MKLICSVLILFIANIAFSQSNIRLKEIENEIKVALENDDYTLASILKMERELRIDLNEAVNVDNFELAAVNKDKIADIERYLSLDDLISVSIKKEDYSVAEKFKAEKQLLKSTIDNNWEKVQIDSQAITEEPKKSTLNEPAPVKEDLTNDDDIAYGKPGGFFNKKNAYRSMGATIGYGGYYDSWITSGFSVGLKWALKWYTEKSAFEKKRVGFNLTYLQGSVNIMADGTKVANISVGNFGLTHLTKFSNNAGFEFNLIVGPNFMVDFDRGWNFGPRANMEFMFRFGPSSFGLDLNYGHGLVELDGDDDVILFQVTPSVALNF